MMPRAGSSEEGRWVYMGAAPELGPRQHLFLAGPGPRLLTRPILYLAPGPGDPHSFENDRVSSSTPRYRFPCIFLRLHTDSTLAADTKHPARCVTMR